MTPIFIFRNGIAVATPSDYAELEDHRALVAKLSTNSYLEAVGVLEKSPLNGWLAADVLTGASWARRYLNTTAKLWTQDKKLAGRGVRAVMRVLSGHEPKVGRHRDGTLSPEVAARAASAVADWRAVVDAEWLGDRAGLASALLRRAEPRFRPSATHRRALRLLVRRPRVRKSEVALTLASWEVGLPLRRIRSTQPVADLVYG